MKDIATVSAYLKTCPKEAKARLNRLRQTVMKAAPGAVESMSYGMIGYKYAGRALVYLGCFKNHIGFFAMPSGKTAFKKDLAKYRGAKSAIQFQHDEPVPYGLVARIVKFRAKENLKKAKR